MPIYCDEAGYTGVNLLEENQPIFVYSGLNIDADEGDPRGEHAVLSAAEPRRRH